MAERLALPTSVHGVVGSNPAVGEILPEPKRRFIAQSLSYSPFHRLEMTEILLKGRKTLTHPLFTTDHIIHICSIYKILKVKLLYILIYIFLLFCVIIQDKFGFPQKDSNVTIIIM